jgi:hypothetical protein
MCTCYQIYLGDQIKKNEMSWTYSIYMGERRDAEPSRVFGTLKPGLK